MNHSRRLTAAICGVTILVVLAGCGGPRTGEVTGKITVKGKAPNVEGMTINFFAPDGRTAAAMVAPDGTYRTGGVPAGSVKVGLSVAVATVQDAKLEAAKPTSGGEVDPKALAAWEKAQKAAADKMVFPEKMRDPATSGLVLTVDPDKLNTFDYDVK
jgi:hypothetical protein